MNSKLSDLLQKYECRLSQIGCTQKPEFLSILSNILAQPDLDPLADLNEYEADSSLLSIEDKLAKLNIDTDSMFIIEDLKTAEVEEEAPQLEPKKAAKKKKKKIKSNVAVAVSEDNEHGAKVDSMRAEQEIKSVASEVSSYVDDIQMPVSSFDRGYVKDISSRTRDMEKPLNQKVIPESNHSEAYKNGKGRKRENAHKAIASTPVIKSSSIALSVVTLEVAPWITELMNAHEYDFKRTIRILYRELSAMELQPEFITRNEKFVFGFISPLTKLPYAITHDIPHGSQLLKGNAAGWIKTIKRSLKEQAVIPS